MRILRMILVGALTLLASTRAQVQEGDLERVAPGVVSTDQNETFPFPSPDGKALYFSRYEDDFVCQTLMVARRSGEVGVSRSPSRSRGAGVIEPRGCRRMAPGCTSLPTGRFPVVLTTATLATSRVRCGPRACATSICGWSTGRTRAAGETRVPCRA